MPDQTPVSRTKFRSNLPDWLEMQSSFDFTTLIFLGLAVFVAWKLRSVLGQKTGTEKPPVDPFTRKGQDSTGEDAPKNASNVIRLPGAANDQMPQPPATDAVRWTGAMAPLAAGLDAIIAHEPDFDPKNFADGARSAYEMIVTAFAAGDRKALKPLLAKDVLDGFETAITDREKRGEKVETAFVSIDKADLTHVEVKSGTAQITMRFASKLITATRDAAGKVVDGDATAVADVTDIWTFSRQLGSRDPSWSLVATEAVV
jgi:predicted lipid-binding transport protein (Tim44 family)